MIRQSSIVLFILFFLCCSVFAAGNKMDKEIYNKISLSNKFYSNKTESLLLQTGQTISYYADDDGDLELGIAYNYTVLTTGQYADSTNVTVNSKTYVFSNACVQDNNTGKMWARTVPQSDIGPATDGKLFWEQYTLLAETCTCNATNKTITADSGTPFDIGGLCTGRIFTMLGSAAGNNGTFTVASISTSVITVDETVVDEASIALDFATADDLIWDLVDQANVNSLAGYTDWRIPNVRELASIIDFGTNNPSIDGVIFPSTPSDEHTTSSTYKPSSVRMWSIDFNYGLSTFAFKTHEKVYVRLVRN